MSMRRPRIKPQVNLATTRRRANAAAATTTKPTAAAAVATTTVTTTARDATKSDTTQHDVNENDTIAATQFPDKPLPSPTTTTLESNTEENQVQVSVIDYNVPTEDANSSTTEYVVTIKNDPETSPIKPAAKTAAKKPAFKKIKPNLIRTTRQPRGKIEKNDVTTEVSSAVQAEKADGNAEKEQEEANFKVPSTHPEENEAKLVDPTANVLQKDMQKEAEAVRTSETEESTPATPAEEARLNDDKNETKQETVENGMALPMKSPQREHLNSTNSLPGSPSPHTTRPSLPPGSRLRTESSCSAFSDSFMTTGGTQKATRRIDEQKRLQRQQARRIFANGPPDKTVMKMSDLIYYNPPTKPMDIKSLPAPTPPKDAKKLLEEAEAQLAEEPPAAPQKPIVPQLKLNAAGELVLDDTSLEIETTAEQQAKKTLANSSLIYVDEYTGMNGFYKRRPRTREWPRDETIKFYRCLQVIGTDFSCMLQLFPNRTRRDLKLKFKKEERVNGQLINKAILNPKTFNVEDLRIQLENEAKEREENDKKWKEFMAKNPKPKKTRDGKSVGGRVLKHGDDVYETEKKQLKEPNNKRKRATKKKDPITTDEKDSELPKETQNPKESEPKSKTNETEPEKKQTRKRRQKKTDENANMENIEAGTQDKEEVPTKRRRGRPRVNNKEVNMVPTLDVGSIKEEFQSIPPTTQPAEAAKENGDENAEATVEGATDQLSTTELEAELNTLIPNETAENGEQQLQPSTAEASNEVMTLKQEPAQYVQKMELDDDSFAIENDTMQLDNLDIDYDDDDDDDDCDAAQDAVSLLFAYKARKSSPKPKPPTPTVVETPPQQQVACDLGEEEIASILKQISDGSMALVSTLDPKDPDKVLNEIYILDKDSGELSDEPLNVPDELVQSILEVMS